MAVVVEYMIKPNPGSDLKAILEMTHESAALWRKHGGEVRFSNRPFEVKHFQTIRHCSVDVASRARASLRNRRRALPPWDSRTR
jgi:hypothetical protein